LQQDSADVACVITPADAGTRRLLAAIHDPDAIVRVLAAMVGSSPGE
jgi:hypothetical protein